MNILTEIIKDIEIEEKKKNYKLEYRQRFCPIPHEAYIPDYREINTEILKTRRTRALCKKLIDSIWKRKTAKLEITVIPEEPKRLSYMIPQGFNVLHVRKRRIQKCLQFFDSKMNNLDYKIN